MPPWMKVSILDGYDADVSTLVEVTSNVVKEKLKDDTWLMWAIAQRANLSLKVDACISTSTVYYRSSLDGDTSGGTVLLRDCLAEVHEGIITCWNFGDEGKILSGRDFRQLMLYLVQDVRESLNHGGSGYIRSRTIDEIFQFLNQITTKSSVASSLNMTVLPDWLEHTLLQSAPQIRLLLMAYTVDLTTVLKSLFEITITPAQVPQRSGRTTWPEVKKAFDNYDNGSLQRIHYRFCDIFQHDQQILGSEKSFRRMFHEFLRDERQGPPALVSKQVLPAAQSASSSVPTRATPPKPTASNTVSAATTNPVPRTSRDEPVVEAGPSGCGCFRLFSSR